LFIFLAYIAWDGIDFWRGSRYQDDTWKKRAQDRGRVTLWFLLPCAGLYPVARLTLPRTTLSTVLLNLLLIALLYAYRLAQDLRGSTPDADRQQQGS
jgi:hypothetical protein